MNKIADLLNQLENKITFFEMSNPEISNGNVGWHIEHSLLTLNGITDFIIKSNPQDYQWKFNLSRIIVLTTKKIPRGKAKAPKVVQPKDSVDSVFLQNHLSETQKKIKGLDQLSSNNYFDHPFFGKIKLKQTIKFLEIHTKHHLDIINDIVKKN
jgi:hypothetical protein